MEYACRDEHTIEQERQKIQDFIQLETLEQQALFFKALGEVHRVKIMHVLMRYDRLCVYEISRLIDATVATTSHHLIMLKKSGIIRCEKDGKHMIYSLENQTVCNLMQLSSRLKAKCPECGQIHE
ncbi:metalloregulator ArsR/SmtB family transcription factor [Aerococcaceae bacterium NML210727]|nr:metalloregulator ArsR/SmtB family transcription factor [Aerococcaceae bacterium NML210727]MCW6654508.1 metalloregulator ArsR/SmtB family transcription factor [Aerococcaceae bacterium NML201296]MCW6661182.1 metalloregulator ArsR/SmtB family transcription factor [Aerococcaceae bacterium NML201209]MCW6662460.1 metalloregulator ArsR/SmtB family transcription factor [Aerococcaceae bacterium NML190073]MCW6664458.1 metalloregulator ArsR/SmtB family transcription factor [Aerococcaceae bacterium NML1